MHSEACNALGASDGVIHSRISQEEVSMSAASNVYIKPLQYHASVSYREQVLGFKVWDSRFAV